jgi:hypothetical protein
MLCNPEFDSEQVDPDLHKRMNKAVEDGSIKCFNMRESNLDGDQDLNFWTREMEDIVREIMEDLFLKAIILILILFFQGWGWDCSPCNCCVH